MSRVLLLEDDEDLAVISRSALVEAGYEVEVVTTVDEAFASCEDSAPDVALVDVQLPTQSGWDFIRRVRDGGRFPQMRVALHSVHLTEPQTRSMAESLGVEVFIDKGDPSQLVDVVRRLTSP